jgi:hypothetical protein
MRTDVSILRVGAGCPAAQPVQTSNRKRGNSEDSTLPCEELRGPAPSTNNAATNILRYSKSRNA